MKSQPTIPTSARRALDLAPQSYDPECREFDVVFSTGATVRRNSWGGRFDEQLLMGPENVRLDRINAGGAFLNSHNGYDLSGQIGVVIPGSARIENGVGVARIRLSEREDVAPIAQDIAAGILRNISVGYAIKGTRITERDGLPDLVEVIDWEPMEISLVPVPADAGAQVRSAEVAGGDIPQESPARKEHTMEELELARQDAAKQERGRVAEILRSANKLKIAPEVYQPLIDNGTDLGEARAAIIDAAAARADSVPTSAPSRIEVTRDAGEEMGRDIEVALAHRADPSKNPLTDGARRFAGFSLMEMSRSFLEAKGVRTSMMSADELAQAALAIRTDAGHLMTRDSGGMLSSSDFPLLLANVANKFLRQGYAEAPQTWRPLVRTVSLRDFKTRYSLQLSAAAVLDPITEQGEYTSGSLTESQETWALREYGKKISLTRKLMINDDLGAFTTVQAKLGQAAARLENNKVWGLVTANAAMSDGVAWFHGTHANLVSASGDKTAPTADSVGATGLKMALQKDIDKVTPLDLTPKFLVAPVALRIGVQKLIYPGMNPTQTSNVVPASVADLVPIFDPRLDANSSTAWYLFADPSQVACIEVGYLSGQEGVAMFAEQRSGGQGIDLIARHDFGCGVVDFRGSVKNPGA